ncbi:MAG TPA: hypothetical protein PKM08_02745 [Syntrophorhabdaceae bacterium]|nr:hypothetical protein [Syntrophorhabdaceae bacterium]HNS14230.1 hypothetical protein [Syntrophorhabdaceae bacterium]HNT67721.1 hypothetical protein [Syntrophorhabdaceae bacterium]
MIRLRLFGRCRIYHDPVSPVLKSPAQVGWAAWFRTIDLVTPQKLKGEELLRRTRGWWTVEPDDIADIVKRHGRLVVGDNGELMVELEDKRAADDLSKALLEKFGDQVLLSP